jgi:galactokinase
MSGPVAASVAAGAAQLFAEHFGRPPEGVWRAPGRVNLIGEHTDYNEGFALPFAIAPGVCVAAGARADGVLALVSRRHGPVIEVEVAELAPGHPAGWAAYPAGMAWAMQGAGHVLGGASIAVDADLPAGAGLSSSAALESAAGLALADLYGVRVSRPELAALGHRAENDFAGAPTGLMDQMAVLLGQAAHALLLDCQAASGTLVPLDLAAGLLALLVIDTRAGRELRAGGYGERRRSCEAAARALGARSLREVRDVTALTGLEPVLQRRARHVVTENARVLAAVARMRAGRLADLGPLLTASHVSLRDDFEVSWPQADATVEAAAGAGALGARMTGGGFGGSVIALAPEPVVPDVAAAVTARFAREGWRPPAVSRAEPADGARRVG